jgi:hypothetical protein
MKFDGQDGLVSTSIIDCTSWHDQLENGTFYFGIASEISIVIKECSYQKAEYQKS